MSKRNDALGLDRTAKAFASLLKRVGDLEKRLEIAETALNQIQNRHEDEETYHWSNEG